MSNPQFGKTVERKDYDSGVSEISEKVFRHGEVVHSELWQEEMVKVLDKSQAASLVIAAIEKLSAGECSALSIDIQSDPATGELSKVVRKWRIG